ncbi:hypothetical protein ACA910_020938 [Epithemia clementina (nom. ined.)]
MEEERQLPRDQDIASGGGGGDISAMDSTGFWSGGATPTSTFRYLHVPEPLRAAELAPEPKGSSTRSKELYWDRSHYDSHESQIAALKKSSTLYVGNLSFSTQTRQVWSHFGRLGLVKAVHLGLDRFRRIPCGFCFVEYQQRSHALAAVSLLSGTKLDGSIIRVELDAGFQEGRQFGRGARGGQVRHDRKKPWSNNNNANTDVSSSYGSMSRKRNRDAPNLPPPASSSLQSFQQEQPEGQQQSAGTATHEQELAPPPPNNTEAVDSYTPSAPSDPADIDDYDNNNFNFDHPQDPVQQPPTKRQRT